MIKGVVAILTSKLIQIIYIYELIYFERTPLGTDASKMFMAVHSNQTDLNDLMMKSKLRIEFLMHTVDTQSFRYFCIKFIDPKTARFKIVKFVDESQDGVYKPDGKNERVNELAGSS